MANGSSPCRRVVHLLVLAVVAHAAAAAPATTCAPAPEAPARGRQLLPLGYSPPPATAEAGGAAAAACLQSVLEASGPCARDVLETLVLKTVRLSTDCCGVLAGVGEECVAAMFSGASVGPALLPVVNRVCGLVALASTG